MTAVAPRRSRSTRRRWATLLGLSMLFHAAVLGGLSLGRPVAHGQGEAPAISVTLIDPPPFVRTSTSALRPVPKPTPTRSVVLADPPPRHAAQPATAATGEAGDAVDLFGPVFADGLWPRPVVVKSEPCDPHATTPAGDDCRRQLLLIGLAPRGANGADSQP
jgi:hypothetical protein